LLSTISSRLRDLELRRFDDAILGVETVESLSGVSGINDGDAAEKGAVHSTAVSTEKGI
jgi:hypothetical protein